MQSAAVKVGLWAASAIILILIAMAIRPSTSEPDIRDPAAVKIRQLREAGNTEALAETAAGTDTAAARRALDALGSLGKTAIPQISRSLVDTRPDVRTRAAAAIGQAGHPQDSTTLVQTLKNDTRPEVRASAALAIGRLNGYPSLDDLLDVMTSDPDKLVRAAAERSFHDITGFQYGYKANDTEAKRREVIRKMRKIIPTVQERYEAMPNKGRRDEKSYRARRPQLKNIKIH